QGFESAHLHAHLFRHDYITRKALDGENRSILKRWAGHRTFEMTDRYFGIAESKLAALRPQAQRAGGHRATATEAARTFGQRNGSGSNAQTRDRGEWTARCFAGA